MPRWAASTVLAVLMIPVPPMKRIFIGIICNRNQSKIELDRELSQAFPAGKR